jgi:serine/threonine protein phosphatase PrpC
LWAYFEDDELAKVVADNSAREACELLIDKARHRAKGGGDNLSLAIVKFVDAPEVKPKPPAGFVSRANP